MNSDDSGVAEAPGVSESSFSQNGNRSAKIFALPGLSDVLALIFLVSASLGVYVWTLLPGLGSGDDNAKWQFIGKVLGVPHSTGYPLYVMLNAIFVRVFQFGSLAWRVNLLSAVFAVGAVCAVYALLRSLRVSLLLALVSALMLTFSQTFWSQAIQAEVYSLHALLMASTLLFFVRWNRTGCPLYFLSGCAVYAVAFGNHMTTCLMLPALIYITLATDKSILRDRRKMLLVALFILTGMLQYGFLIWCNLKPDTPYVEISFESVGGFVSFVTGGQFRGTGLAPGPKAILFERLPDLTVACYKQYYIGLFIAVYGFVATIRHRWSHFLLIYFITNAAFAVCYPFHVWKIYLIPNFLVGCIYMGIGLEQIRSRLFHRLPDIALAVLLLLPLWAMFHQIDQVSLREENEIEQEIKEMLDIVDRDAIILTPHYFYSHVFYYYTLGEGLKQSRNIYVRLVDYEGLPADVVDSVIEGKPLWLPTPRQWSPAGLDFYIVLPRWHADKPDEQPYMRALREDLVAEKMGKQIYRLLPPKKNETGAVHTPGTEQH